MTLLVHLALVLLLEVVLVVVKVRALAVTPEIASRCAFMKKMYFYVLIVLSTHCLVW